MTATAAEPVTRQDLRATCSRDDLIDALRFASLAVPRRAPVPVLAGVLLEGGSGSITVTGFDYETHARAEVAAAGARGRALVPIRALQPMLGVLPKGCEVSLRVDGSCLRVLGAGVAYTVPLLPIDDYPDLPAAQTEAVATVSGAQLQQLARVLCAVGRDDSLPVLTTVALEVVDGLLTAAATDRYRLALVTTDVRSPLAEGTKVLVPGWQVRAAATRFRTAPRVTVTMTPNADPAGPVAVAFEAPSRYLSARGTGGQFPQIRSLVPETFPITAQLATADLAIAVQQVAIAAERNTPVRLNLAGDTLELRSGLDDDPAFGVTASKDVAAAITGIPGRIAFNPAYLLDGLKACTGEQVVIGLQDPIDITVNPYGEAKRTEKHITRPAVLISPDDPTFRYLLMPVRTAG